jgi:hypothetical protein
MKFLFLVILYCHVIEWYYRWVELLVGFIAHLYTQLVTTSNYSAIDNSHTLQFTTVRNNSI